MVDVTPAIARQLGVTGIEGAAVTGVLPDSPAEKAGLKARDIIRKFNGLPVKDMLALRGRVAESDIGTRIELGIIRDGAEQTVSAVIAEAPAMPAAAAPQK
jgi:serine protease DegQ